MNDRQTSSQDQFIASAHSVWLIAILLLAGCTTNKITTTARSATEQLLLSTAADHALQNADLKVLAGRKVFLDSTYFDSYDSKYVLATIRDALSRAGALLENSQTNSDIIVEARNGAMAIDESDSLFGIPGVKLPVPMTGSLETPQISFYSSQRQDAIAKIALIAYARQSAVHIYSSGPMAGSSFDKKCKLFFVSWRHTDVPELQSERERARHYQTWFPQYDLTNLTATNVGPWQKR